MIEISSYTELSVSPIVITRDPRRLLSVKHAGSDVTVTDKVTTPLTTGEG
jgi:hypothetical protein